VARELVALVSSCQALPWMMLVTPSVAYWRTRFHTLITSPQVVSTNWQPRALSFSMVAVSVPNAGMMTTSPARRSSRSAFFSLPDRNRMSIERS
jgi:hypothetical protein